MPIRQPRYSSTEFAQRGQKIYDQEIRAVVEAQHRRQFVAIDIESHAWEVSPDALEACDRLIARNPDSQLWLVRVGSAYLHRIGGSRRVRIAL